MAEEEKNVFTALKDLQRRYAERLERRLEAIREEYRAVETSDWAAEAGSTLHRSVHALTGAAGTFGFPAVSSASREFEQLLAGIMTTGNRPSADERADAARALESLETAARPGLLAINSYLTAPPTSTVTESP